LFGVCQWYVLSSGKKQLYSSAQQIPARKVGLLLGTAEKRRGGGPNPFFRNRIDAAVELYKRGKIRRLLVSGDNQHNEPEDMRKALLAGGVPASAITRDHAGLRTLDSVVRAKEVFGVSTFTIISQRDHDQRALLIAKQNGIDAIAFCARDVPLGKSILAHVHEWFARVKVVLDLYLLHTRPKHIGSRVLIPIK
jgi:SanA protein